MTVYNINQGIGWASSGVEYAQSYRGKIFRKLGVPARFVFTDMIRGDNIQEMAQALDFTDDEVIWLYRFYTDFTNEPCSLSEEEVAATFPEGEYKVNELTGGKKQYVYGKANRFITVYFSKNNPDKVSKVEIVDSGYLIRTDYYTSGKTFSEYCAPFGGQARVYMRRFFNRDGSTAFEEYLNYTVHKDLREKSSIYRFPDRIFYSKMELAEDFMKRLPLEDGDIIIADRTTLMGQAIFKYRGNHRLGIVIHAEHYNAGSTDDDNILWNNFYEFPFHHCDEVDFFITSTKKQKENLERQFEKYFNKKPRIVDIPVGSIDKLKRPSKDRKPHSLCSVSRLASEKHVDWVVRAVIEARKKVPDLSLDIFGKGGEERKLRELISENHADDYIRLMGHHKMDEYYRNYSGYISGSTSEGFGLSLMEAVGSGLPMIGLDVPYGNQTFIEDGKNGYLIPYCEEDAINSNELIGEFADRIDRLFTEDHVSEFSMYSYMIASQFLTDKVEEKMKTLLEEL
ncbi:MAG: accessory Sec system glycosyltransferase GtfA [Butyrivibrio sp.]|uniref:accessory Sec system glycosyltransferase GtfA n=1 Tax=Butyrivibrio sp. TaxID=28121 RepID=UPI001B7002AC|nr:accessory Sec system glycosyltransferase GtfA [Butyrivibrio sp.]MBP3783421.1 accessory Sec system glycosyltransferase GtfA [Butyrivibrio sp.]MBP3814586.1 accessory Sec system glycosyltransferase GtfA [Butyrivibrio sp.]